MRIKGMYPRSRTCYEWNNQTVWQKQREVVFTFHIDLNYAVFQVRVVLTKKVLASKQVFVIRAFGIPDLVLLIENYIIKDVDTLTHQKDVGFIPDKVIHKATTTNFASNIC